MPRTVAEILAQAEVLAQRFEEFEPSEDGREGAPLRAVREAFEDLALAQKRLSERVSTAKASGHSWAAIGAMLGTSGEAARQRYGSSKKSAVPPGGKGKPATGKASAGRVTAKKATAAAPKGTTSAARVAVPPAKRSK